MIYYVTTNNSNRAYTSIWNIQRYILDYYGIRHVEGVEGTENRLLNPGDKNPIFTFKKRESPKHVDQFFNLCIQRWFLALYPVFKDDDTFVIGEGDAIDFRIADTIAKLEKEVERRDDKVIAPWAYSRNPKKRFCSEYQSFKVGTMRWLFNKYENSIDNVIDSAERYGQGYTNGYKSIDESWLGENYYSYDLCHWIDWDSLPYKKLDLNPPDLMNADPDTFDLENYFQFHGYVGDQLHDKFIGKVTDLLNAYYKRHRIDLRIPPLEKQKLVTEFDFQSV